MLSLDPHSLFTTFKIRLDSLARTTPINKEHTLRNDFVPWVAKALEQGLPIDIQFLRQRILIACPNVPEARVAKIFKAHGL